MKASTEKGVNFERGVYDKETDELYEVNFLKYEPLAGFVGYENEQITGIGFYRYMCASRPEGLGPNGEPLPGTDLVDPSGEGEGEEVTDPDTVVDPTDLNIDPDKDKICEDGDAECVTPQPDLKESVESLNNLTTILVILFSVLVGLVILLVIIVIIVWYCRWCKKRGSGKDKKVTR